MKKWSGEQAGAGAKLKSLLKQASRGGGGDSELGFFRSQHSTTGRLGLKQLYLDAVPSAVTQAWNIPMKNLKGFCFTITK